MSDTAKFAIIKFKDYRPSIIIGNNSSAYQSPFKVWNSNEITNQDIFFSSFNVTYSMSSSPSLDLEIPLVSEKILNNFKFGDHIKLYAGLHKIFDGYLVRSQYSNGTVTLNCRGLTYILQHFYNVAIEFMKDANTPETNLQNIVTSLISETLEANGIDKSNFNIEYFEQSDTPIEMTIDPQKFSNIDSYSALQQILSSAGMIGFETLYADKPTFVLGHYTAIKNKFFQENLQEVPVRAFYDRTKTYDTSGIINAIFVLDKNSGNYVMIYPNDAPAYIPQKNMEHVISYSSPFPDLKLVFSAVAIYDQLPKGQTVDSLGKALIDASYLNYTNATFKFPGLPFQDQNQPTPLFPGVGFSSVNGVGFVANVTYSFSNMELWTEVEVLPQGAP